MHKHRLKGWTLIECLVAMSMVVLILAIALPGTLQARYQARAVQCKNNLKQLGLALHNYHDTFVAFPPGWVTGNRENPSARSYGWQFSILPFVDEAPLYTILADRECKFSPSKTPRKELLKAIPYYRCPEDMTPALNPFREKFATSNYSGNAGHKPLPMWTGTAGINDWPGQIPLSPTKPYPQLNSGFFGPNSFIRIAHVVDGTSNTIMVGERSFTSGAGIWPGLTSQLQFNDAVTDGSHASRLNKNMRSFSSVHANKTLNFLMADGAVRAIDPNVESLPNSDIQQPLGIFQKLCSRDDGQPVNQP